MTSMFHGQPTLRENIVTDNREYRCAIRNLYHEARGESLIGRAFVMKTVLNRVRDTKHPHSICKVIYEKKQFSWTIKIPKHKQLVPCKTIAEKELLSRLEILSTAVIWIDRLGWDFTQNSQYYHNMSVKPVWRHNLIKTKQIGNHIFYRRMENDK